MKRPSAPSKTQGRSVRQHGFSKGIQLSDIPSRKFWYIILQIIFVALPVLISSKMFMSFWNGAESRAWDGSGHFAIAQNYNQSIFPDTFGWTHSYFGGMPFPTFYPPLFYWCVALIHYTHLVSFATAFKFTLVVPVILIPAAMWWLGWSLFDGNRVVAAAVAMASVVLLIDTRFMGALLAGLDYFSTFQIGLYTQPLGFILLLGWFVVYSSPGNRLKFALSSILLALTILANFFNAATAAVLVLATLACDLFYCYRASTQTAKQAARRVLLTHFLSPVVAALLALFWIVPMISEYSYFVTRPYTVDTRALFTPALLIWYALAIVGSVLWLRQPTRAAWSYIGACIILTGAVLLGSVVAPRWFPLQTPRFVATLTFMLAIPVGYTLAAAFRSFASILGEASSKNPLFSLHRMRYTFSIAVVGFLVLATTAPDLSRVYAFYSAGEKKQIDAVLNFAHQHQDGRYLVEVINQQIGPAWTEASFDARAINSYLGSQGNETISGVFHEASPNALFTLPVVNAFSNYPDSFGVSSVLADDLDFAAQPLSEQLKRAQFLGVKYLVIRTPAMKERVSKEITTAVRHDLGWWSVFELRGPAAPKIQVLPYKPALVLSSFTVKARRRNELSFVRLAEEQFADNWFDVLLVRSAEAKIDRLKDLDKFGALIVESYDWSDENAAFERLREFASTRPLILLSGDNSLFHRLQTARGDFPCWKSSSVRLKLREKLLMPCSPVTITTQAQFADSGNKFALFSNGTRSRPMQMVRKLRASTIRTRSN